MNPQEIKEFLKSIRETDIEEMEYRSGSDSLYFKKSETGCTGFPVMPVKVVENKQMQEKDFMVSIKSTMVGTFSNKPSSDENPFVKEGDSIAVDQKIGQIEAMKVVKDVKSKVKGKIIKVLVLNGQPVEYGQELFLVDTSK
jgi:biotin carboxyl carrier protein